MALRLLVVLSVLIMINNVGGYKTDCTFHSYAGNPGQVIAKFQPTLPGKISLSISEGFLKKIFNKLSPDSLEVRQLPGITGALGVLVGVIGDLTDNTVKNMEALQNAINDLIDDVRKTVNDLKTYVDAKFDEYDYDKKSDALKGIYLQSSLCTSFAHPPNKEACLKNMMFSMVEKYSVFLPDDPKYETFEQQLPLTRQFADVHFAILIDTLNMTNFDRDYKIILANFSVAVYNYFVHGINNIVHQHFNNIKGVSCNPVDERHFCVPICYSSPCTCYCTHIGAYMCEQHWDSDDGCKQEYSYAGEQDNCMIAGFTWPSKAKDRVQKKLATYKKDLETAIRKYWAADVGQTMENWKKLGIKVGAKDSSFLPYSINATTAEETQGAKNPVLKFIGQIIHAIRNEIIKHVKNRRELNEPNALRLYV